MRKIVIYREGTTTRASDSYLNSVNSLKGIAAKQKSLSVLSLMLFICLLTVSCSEPSKHELLTQRQWKVVSSTDESFARSFTGNKFLFSPDGKWNIEVAEANKGGSFCTNKGNWHFEENETKIIVTCMMNWATRGLTEERVVFNIIRLTPKNLDLNRDAAANDLKRSYQISLEAE